MSQQLEQPTPIHHHPLPSPSRHWSFDSTCVESFHQRRGNITSRRRRAGIDVGNDRIAVAGIGLPRDRDTTSILFPLQTSPPSPPAACLTGLAADGPDVHRPQWPAQSSPDSRRTKPKGQVPTKMTPFPPRKCLCGVRGTGAESKILSQTKGQLGSRPTAYAVVPYPFLPQPLSIAAPLPAVWSISRLSALWRLQTQGGERTGSSNGTPAHLDS